MLRKLKGQVSYCYYNALMDDVAGVSEDERIELSFKVREGRPHRLRARGRMAEPLESCVLGKVRRWPFTHLPDGTRVVVIIALEMHERRAAEVAECREERTRRLRWEEAQSPAQREGEALLSVGVGGIGRIGGDEEAYSMASEELLEQVGWCRPSRPAHRMRGAGNLYVEAYLSDGRATEVSVLSYGDVLLSTCVAATVCSWEWQTDAKGPIWIEAEYRIRGEAGYNQIVALEPDHQREIAWGSAFMPGWEIQRGCRNVDPEGVDPEGDEPSFERLQEALRSVEGVPLP